MARTIYRKKYIEQIIVDRHCPQSVKVIDNSPEYQFDRNGECSIEMRFFDGLAVATDESGIVMLYPSLKEIINDKCRKDEIVDYTDRDEICQYEVALKFGVLDRYKMVADYNLWIMQGDNGDKDVWAIHTSDGTFLFDTLEDDYCMMLDADMVEDGYLTKDYDNQQISNLRMRYGILWTDKIKDELIK